ncbi:MAG: hypothetical protein SFY66_24235 [Oculatellaceae cyanobacterium bins.114]|nr:hypothetical protein [Oculatellaceae cyanobacterium bins.114]
MTTSSNPGSSKSATTQQALEAIAKFEGSSKPGVWPHLDKKAILADMRSRVNDPFKINQGQQPFCGPTAVLFELVRKQPLRYVEMCRSLFEDGSFKGKTKTIPAPNRLRESSKGNLLMGQADWMILATLREAESLIFPVDPDAPSIIRSISGMSFSWEMSGWTSEILGYNQINYSQAFRKGDLFALRDANNIVKLGGVGFALITAQGLLGTASTTEADMPLSLPNHWVALLGNVAAQNGRVSFDVYSWGKKMHVDVTEDNFKSAFWGIVTGMA